jgi:thioredoxin-like negative regulator of GroEL
MPRRPEGGDMIDAVEDREFDRVVESSGVPVLIEFWQPGCGACRGLLTCLEEVDVQAAGRVRILTMNVQENHQIPAELEISSLPALALYRDGRFERFIGGLARPDLILQQLDLT